MVDCDVKSSFVAWTTTPWTLPSNLALCVNPQFIYVYLKDPVGTVFIVAKSCISVIPGAMNKKEETFRWLANMQGSSGQRVEGFEI